MTKEEVLQKQRTNMALAAAELDAGTVMIGDTIINSTVSMNDPGTPALTDTLFIVKVKEDGTKEYVRYTVQALIDALGADVSESAQNAADSAISAAASAESALASKNYLDGKLDEVDDTTADAKTEISEAKTNALSEISTAIDSSVGEIEDAKDEALNILNSKMHVGYRTFVGDGSSTSFTITHNLGCSWVLCQVWFTDLGAKYYHSIHEIDENSIKIDFNYPPPANSVDVRIVPNIRIEEGGGSLPEDFEVSKDMLANDVECSAQDVSDLIAILG